MHTLNLYKRPFENIKLGNKTVEMRLYKEKISKIKIGDIIKFISLDNGDTIQTKVLDIKHYENFKDLYNNYNKLDIGYYENETADYRDMLEYYKKEDIDRLGVVAIEIKVV